MLTDYLKKEWIHNNHKKYHKYFNEWFKNLTDNQLMYFKKDMLRSKTN